MRGAREKPSDHQAVIVVSFDLIGCMKERRDFSGPITDQSNPGLRMDYALHLTENRLQRAKNRYTHPWHKIWRNAEECRNSEKRT